MVELSLVLKYHSLVALLRSLVRAAARVPRALGSTYSRATGASLATFATLLPPVER
jgi:hypothetical protein